MKVRQFFCSILIFFFCSLAAAQSNSVAGTELCNQVHSFLSKNNYSPENQKLLASGINNFPYNIIVTFSPKENTSSENLILVFFQEDVLKNQKLIKQSLDIIKNANYPFTVTALFANGEKQLFEKSDMIFGSRVFIDSLSSNLSYTAIIFDLEAQKSGIETTAAGLCSPPWLIKNSLNLFAQQNTNAQLPLFILSQISSYKFIKSPILQSFFENEIPAIRLNIDSKITGEEKEITAKQIITKSVEDFSNVSDTSWEHHFLITRVFGKYRIISESFILQIVIPTIFVWLIFIFILIFVNRRLKLHAWQKIGKIWWSVPLTYLIISLSFFISGLLFKAISPAATDAGKIYGLLATQIITSLFFVLAIYIIILSTNFGFEEGSVDYLLVISCFINQSLFILADISLSPIFITICILSLFALTIKNNTIHFVIFILMIMPLVPYAHRMIGSADLSDLSYFLRSNYRVNFVIPFVLYPVYIVLLRVLTSIRTNRKKISKVIISTIMIFILVFASLLTLSIIRTSQANKKIIEKPQLTLSTQGSGLISVNYYDTNIFNDIVRTVNISLERECILCDFLISTNSNSPVLYSDNDYTNVSNNSVRFRIPDNPPKQMTFSYGAAKTPCKITVSAVIKDEQGKYLFITKAINIGVL
ncbi:MAG: hypothetical protein J6X84_01080 [Treponema sp.]|nr:hypothetical protein [Treponema sp.]